MPQKALNQDQEKVLQINRGVLLVIAGPGTGKTFTLTAKIKFLLQQMQLPPAKILALTFTRQAAAELKTRLSKSLPSRALPLTTTFHGLAYRLLQERGLLGSRRIISAGEKRKFGEKGSPFKIPPSFQDLSPRQLELKISQYKIKFFFAQEKIPPAARELLQNYQSFLNEKEALDFDDLLLLCWQELEKDKEGNWPRWPVILVDEFQDTNLLQYQLLRKWWQDHHQSSLLCAIGDPQQSIYGFRGAVANIFEQLAQDFTTVTKVELRHNYRNKAAIIHFSSRLFPAVQQIPQQKGEGKIWLVETKNEFSEARWIAQRINILFGGIDMQQSDQLPADEGEKNLSFRDIAILYRFRRQGRIIAQELEKQGLPFQEPEATNLYQQPAVQWLLFLLSQTQPNLVQHWRAKVSRAHEIPLTLFFLEEKNLSLPPEITEKKDQLLRDFAKTYRSHATTENPLSLVDAARFWVKNPFTQKYFQQNPAIDQLLREIEKMAWPWENLPGYFEYLAQLEENNFYDLKSDKISLLTIHAAKGLEFQEVFLCGFEEGIIPPQRKDTSLAEEKRLFYVALTRASQSLYLLYARYREKKKKELSSFIKFFAPSDYQKVLDPFWQKEKKRKARSRQQKLVF